MDGLLEGMESLFESTHGEAEQNTQVAFNATFVKAWTGADKGWNVTFALSEYDADKVIEISSLKDKVLSIGVVARGEP